MKKVTIILALIFSFTLTGFSSTSFATDIEKNKTWDFIEEKAKKDGVDTEKLKATLKEANKELKRAHDNWSNELDEEEIREVAKQKGIDPDPILNENPNQVSTFATSSILGTYGDVLVTMDQSSSKGLFNYGHAAIVEYDNSYTVESFPDGGVKRYTNNWKTRYNKVKGMWVRGAGYSDYTDAQNYAKAQKGDPYNWEFYWKWNPLRFYCSQLVWRAWYEQGFELDPSPSDNTITPQGLIDSSQTTTFYSQGF